MHNMFGGWYSKTPTGHERALGNASSMFLWHKDACYNFNFFTRQLLQGQPRQMAPTSDCIGSIAPSLTPIKVRKKPKTLHIPTAMMVLSPLSPTPFFLTKMNLWNPLPSMWQWLLGNWIISWRCSRSTIISYEG